MWHPLVKRGMHFTLEVWTAITSVFGQLLSVAGRAWQPTIVGKVQTEDVAGNDAGVMRLIGADSLPCTCFCYFDVAMSYGFHLHECSKHLCPDSPPLFPSLSPLSHKHTHTLLYKMVTIIVYLCADRSAPASVNSTLLTSLQVFIFIMAYLCDWLTGLNEGFCY